MASSCEHVMNFRVTQKMENFLISWVTISFLRWIPFHGVCEDVGSLGLRARLRYGSGSKMVITSWTKCCYGNTLSRCITHSSN